MQEFLIHAAIYMVFNDAFIVFNPVDGSDFPWFSFLLIVWGIGLAIHYTFDVRLVNR